MGPPEPEDLHCFINADELKFSQFSARRYCGGKQLLMPTAEATAIKQFSSHTTLILV